MKKKKKKPRVKRHHYILFHHNEGKDEHLCMGCSEDGHIPSTTHSILESNQQPCKYFPTIDTVSTRAKEP